MRYAKIALSIVAACLLAFGVFASEPFGASAATASTAAVYEDLHQGWGGGCGGTCEDSKDDPLCYCCDPCDCPDANDCLYDS